MSPLSPLARKISEAGSRIYSIARRTPADPSPGFSSGSGTQVYFKLENLQYTGSFKLRGVTNKLLSLDEAERKRGCVAASTGNHGAAAAYAFVRLGVAGEIFVPETANPSKVDAIKRLGGDVYFHGTDPGETESHARRYAAECNKIYISPYNDPEVVAGQGTVGLELLDQVPNLEAVFVAVGGGGLIGGIGACVKRRMPHIKVIGCVPENSPVMLRSVEAGKVVDCKCRPTLSDGTAGNMDHDSITLEICRQVVDQWLLLSEDEIRTAMRRFIQIEHMLLEGAAGVALAGFEKHAEDYQGKDVAVVICGRNLDIDTLRSVL